MAEEQKPLPPTAAEMKEARAWARLRDEQAEYDRDCVRLSGETDDEAGA